MLFKVGTTLFKLWTEKCQTEFHWKKHGRFSLDHSSLCGEFSSGELAIVARLQKQIPWHLIGSNSTVHVINIMETSQHHCMYCIQYIYHVVKKFRWLRNSFSVVLMILEIGYLNKIMVAKVTEVCVYWLPRCICCNISIVYSVPINSDNQTKLPFYFILINKYTVVCRDLEV